MTNKETLIPGVMLTVDDTPVEQLTREETKNLINKTPEQANGRVLSLEETAALLGMTQQTIRNWEKSKKLIPIVVGKQKRYLEKDVNKLRRAQMGASQIILNNTTVLKLEKMFHQLFGIFDPMEPINITITNDVVSNLIKVDVSTPNENVSISRHFKTSEFNGGEMFLD